MLKCWQKVTFCSATHSHYCCDVVQKNSFSLFVSVFIVFLSSGDAISLLSYCSLNILVVVTLITLSIPSPHPSQVLLLFIFLPFLPDYAETLLLLREVVFIRLPYSVRMCLRKASQQNASQQLARSWIKFSSFGCFSAKKLCCCSFSSHIFFCAVAFSFSVFVLSSGAIEPLLLLLPCARLLQAKF